MKSLIRILHLEDNPIDSQLVQSALKRADVNFEYFFSDNEKDFHSTLTTQNIDIILSDYHLPDYSGSEALLFAKYNFPQIPFVFLSGTMGEDAAIESLLNGATDYVLKNKMDRLVPAIYRAFNEMQAQKARLNAEKALHQSEENFRISISESPLGIRIITVDGQTVYANKAFLDIYEFTSLDEFNSTPSKDRYTEESYIQHLERQERRKKGEDTYEYEFSILRKNKEIRHVKVSRKEVLWNGTNHYQVINQDITEQKKLTEDLIAAKKKAEESEHLKSAFLANMSHEIRTPMNGILGFAGLLKEPNLTGDEQQEYIAIIEKSGARMLNIINNIVDISKIEAGLMELDIKESNLIEQIEYIYTFFKPEVEAKGLDLRFKNSLNPNEAVIKTDREKVYAILTNLVKNAIKFTSQGSIEFGCGKNAKVLEFFVRDTGIGIPKDRQEAIFERFIQADIGDKRAFQGAGLGLSITKAYVEMLGGKIWVESEPGEGSTFYFTIPLEIESEEKNLRNNSDSDSLEASQIDPEGSGLKILIVEDDEGSALLISIAIRVFSKVILKAKTGIEAVELCRQNPDLDLILMDIKMPEMDGYQATKEIRKFNNDVIIIAQTAYALSGDREKAIEAGCNNYISKPIKKSQLMLLMQQYFLKNQSINN